MHITEHFISIWEGSYLSAPSQESKGYEFESETDTESIAKLVKYMYDNRENDEVSFATLVEQVTQQLVSIQTFQLLSERGTRCLCSL